MTLAETASIFSEFVALQGALAEADDDERLTLSEHFLQDACQVCVDILCRFLFEQEVFEKRRQEELTAEGFSRLMVSCQKRTYGELSAYHPYMWAVKGHYYSSDFSYYNYPYAFGQLFGLGLYAEYEKDKASFEDKYVALLSRTGSMSAMSSVDNWRFGFGSTFRFFSMTLETVLMKFPYSTEKDQLAILCLPGLSLSLSSLTALELGFGPSLGLLVPKSGNSESDYQYVLADGSVEDSDASFSDLFMPISRKRRSKGCWASECFRKGPFRTGWNGPEQFFRNRLTVFLFQMQGERMAVRTHSDKEWRHLLLHGADGWRLFPESGQDSLLKQERIIFHIPQFIHHPESSLLAKRLHTQCVKHLAFAFPRLACDSMVPFPSLPSIGSRRFSGWLDQNSIFYEDNASLPLGREMYYQAVWRCPVVDLTGMCDETNDGQVEPGERIWLCPVLHSEGRNDDNRYQVRISSSSPYLELSETQLQFGVLSEETQSTWSGTYEKGKPLQKSDGISVKVSPHVGCVLRTQNEGWGHRHHRFPLQTHTVHAQDQHVRRQTASRQWGDRTVVQKP